jgi:hypothetical protein
MKVQRAEAARLDGTIDVTAERIALNRTRTVPYQQLSLDTTGGSVRPGAPCPGTPTRGDTPRFTTV